MSRSSKSISAPLEAQTTTEDAVIRAVYTRLGLDQAPTKRAARLPVDCLVIPHVDQDVVRRGHKMAQSFKTLGQMSPVGVVQSRPDGESAVESVRVEQTYPVCYGRARTFAGGFLWHEECLPEWETIDTYIYDVPATATRTLAMISLVENLQRSAAWVNDLRKARDLVHDGMLISAREFAHLLCIPLSSAETLFTIVSLPEPIVEQALSGVIRSRSILQRIARLRPAEQNALARQAENGVPITADFTKQLLQGQIALGFNNPMFQSVLEQDLTPVASDAGVSAEEDPILLSSPQRPPRKTRSAQTAVVPTEDGTLQPLHAMLQAKLPTLRGKPAYQELAALAQAMLIELDPLVKAEHYLEKEAV